MGSPELLRKKVPKFSHPKMTYCRAREPIVFQETPDEDAKNWLMKFEEITETNNWEAHRLSYVRWYLEGTSRHWLLFVKPSSCQEFRTNFLMARRQRKNESLENEFFDVINLCNQLQEESSPMSKLDRIDRLLAGMKLALLKNWF